MGICKAECGVEGRVATFKAGAAAHQDVVVPGACGEVLAPARSNRAHTPRRKALRCVSSRGAQGKGVWRGGLCPIPCACASELDSASGAPGRKTHSRGSLDFVHEDKCAKSAVESAQSRLLWKRHRVGEHEVEPYPLTVYKLHLFVAWSPTEFVYLSAANKDHIKLGYLWTVAVD